MENVEEIGLNVTLKLIYFWTMSENRLKVGDRKKK